MAALIKHGLSKNNEIIMNLLLRNYVNVLSCRCYANKKYKQKLEKVEAPKCRKLKSTEDSIATRGFLRCQKSYEPPDNVEERLENVCLDVAGNTSQGWKSQLDPSIKYSLLSACFTEFGHSVPNSILHTIKKYDDLLEFYKTPLDARLPLDKLKDSDLPPNLHIQMEPVRFLAEEDTMFNGQTAFPKSNTLVTGLRTKRKYKGHKDTDMWPVGIKDL